MNDSATSPTHVAEGRSVRRPPDHNHARRDLGNDRRRCGAALPRQHAGLEPEVRRPRGVHAGVLPRLRHLHRAGDQRAVQALRLDVLGVAVARATSPVLPEQLGLTAWQPQPTYAAAVRATLTLYLTTLSSAAPAGTGRHMRRHSERSEQEW